MTSTAVALVLALAVTGCADTGSGDALRTGAPAPCPSGPPNPLADYVDFVRVDGRMHVRSGLPATAVPDRWVGEVLATVRCTLAETAAEPGERRQDGDASYLPVGTQVHALAGAPPALRVVARADGAWQVYEAVDVPTASTGADLLDLRDVLRVSLVESFEGRDVVRSVTEPAAVARVVEAVRSAPVLTEGETQAAVRGPMWFVRFELADGPPVQAAYYPDGGVLLPRIQAPEVLREALGV